MPISGSLEDAFRPLILLLLLLAAASSFHLIKSRREAIINVPTVPPSSTVLSRLITSYKWHYDSPALVKLGMDLHGRFGRSFKIPGHSRWYLLITKPQLIEELKAVPQSIMSFRHALDEQVRTDRALYKGLMVEVAMVDITRKYLSSGKSLARLIPLLTNELRLSWIENAPSELLDSASTEWVGVDVIPTLQAIITRTANRIFFGAELARNKELEEMMLQFTVNYIASGKKLNLWPQLLQPLVAGRIYAWKKKCMAAIKGFLDPVIEERRQKLQTLGESWKSRPYDAIQWVLDHEPEASTEVIICRLIFLVTASVHTDILTMSHIIYDLAGHPDIQPVLRREIPIAKGEDAMFTHDGLSLCTLLDSVIKESARMNGVDIGAIRRQCMKPYTFSDGTHVTPGTCVMAPGPAIHRLPSVYPDPDVFDSYRFQNLRSMSADNSSHQYVQTSVDYLVWGHGTLACPGRFLASDILKLLTAELIESYEWKFKDGEGRPENMAEGLTIFPARATVLFRRLPKRV